MPSAGYLEMIVRNPHSTARTRAEPPVSVSRPKATILAAIAAAAHPLLPLYNSRKNVKIANGPTRTNPAHRHHYLT